MNAANGQNRRTAGDRRNRRGKEGCLRLSDPLSCCPAVPLTPTPTWSVKETDGQTDGRERSGCDGGGGSNNGRAIFLPTGEASVCLSDRLITIVRLSAPPHHSSVTFKGHSRSLVPVAYGPFALPPSSSLLPPSSHVDMATPRRFLNVLEYARARMRVAEAADDFLF